MKFALTTSLILLASVSYALASDPKLSVTQWVDPAVEPVLVKQQTKPQKNKNLNHRPTIALALGGGGIRGASHIGVLRVLKSEGIPIDYIAGCSMGAIIGGFYCAGVSLDDTEKMLQDNTFVRSFAPRWIALSLLSAPAKSLISTLTFKDGPSVGLVSGRYFSAFLDKQLQAGHKLIENTNPPFVAIATNLNDGKVYKFIKGKLSDCIVASSAAPLIVRPVEINGGMYLDGGLRCNVPVPAAKEFEPDIVIAVSIDQLLPAKPKERFKTVMSLASRITNSLFCDIDEHDSLNADVVITPNLSNIPVFTRKLKYVSPAIKAGEEATYAALPAIKAAIKNCEANFAPQG